MTGRGRRLAVKHWKGRPPKDSQDVQRWTGRAWVPDDGKPGRAFSGRLQGFPMAWGPDCDCPRVGTCPQDRAMRHTCERFGCANGRMMKQV